MSESSTQRVEQTTVAVRSVLRMSAISPKYLRASHPSRGIRCPASRPGFSLSSSVMATAHLSIHHSRLGGRGLRSGVRSRTILITTPSRMTSAALTAVASSLLIVGPSVATEPGQYKRPVFPHLECYRWVYSSLI